jgi:hypothetical protein
VFSAELSPGARITILEMQLAWTTGGRCGSTALFLILGLLCCTAGARNPASTVANSVAIFLHSEHQDIENPSDEGKNENTWSGRRKDYNRETPVVWLNESGLPITIEFLIAFCWIGMVASMPLVVIMVEGGKITRIQIINFTVMWLVLAGGIFLFHKVLLFQSAHFVHQRSLTLVECVYLMAQILTTVGYGDITPADKTSQVFVALYVMVSLLIIANVASEAAEALKNRTTKFAEELRNWTQTQIKDRLYRTFSISSSSAERFASRERENSGMSSSQMWIRRADLPPLQCHQLLQSIFMYGLFCVMGAMFYLNYPGENKTVLDCVYMCVITLSTVGFGAVTPQTEGGKVFGSFWMFFGTASLFKLVGDFMAFVVMMKQREMWNAEEEMKKGIERAQQLPDQLTAHDFMKFSLVQRGLMQQKDVDMLDKAFLCLNPAEEGTISKEDARKFLDLAD